MRQKFWLKQYQYRASVTFIRRAVLGWNIKEDKFEIWHLYESEMGPDQAECQIHVKCQIHSSVWTLDLSRPTEIGLLKLVGRTGGEISENGDWMGSQIVESI